MDKIELYVNGALYEGWKRVSVDRSIESVSGSFTLETGDKWEMNKDPLKIKPGDKCEVRINDQPVITGWIDSSSRSADKESHNVSVSGRDVTCDIVDCSAIVTSFELKNITLYELAVMLCKPFGIKVVDKTGDNEAFLTVAIQPGETVWDCIDRQARQRDVTVITDGQGSLVLCAAGGEKVKDSLVLGENLLSASVDLDLTELFSEYIVKAQLPSTGDSAAAWEAPKNAVEGKCADSNVKRYRPLLITSEEQSYDKSAGARAEREKRKRIGEAVVISADVTGWTQSDGSLWKLGAVVGFQAPALGFSSDEFIIASLSHSIDDSGTMTHMTLKNPDAFLSEETKKKDKKKDKKKSKKSGAGKKQEDYSAYWGD